MDNEDKSVLAMVVVAVVAIGAAVLISLFYFNPTIEPIPTSELPDGYEIGSECWAEGEESVEISHIFFRGKIGQTAIFPPGKMVEMDISVSFPDGDHSRFIIRDETGGEWTSSTFTAFTYEGEEVERWGITWTKKLSPNETIILPTKEEVTFVGFDYNSCEDEFIPKFIWE